MSKEKTSEVGKASSVGKVKARRTKKRTIKWINKIPSLDDVKIKLVNKVRYTGDVQPGCFYKQGNKYVIEVKKSLKPNHSGSSSCTRLLKCSL
ncbi:hypothetical protein HRbin19_01279 [bacterium HR19]|nr:hypothetical protein HRbin19_01279 [bacterium HR19]